MQETYKQDYRQLVRRTVSNEQQRQKDFYNVKVHGDPYQKGDLVWLHTPVVKNLGASRKLHHPWTGHFKVVKRISKSTYHIQHAKWYILID